MKSLPAGFKALGMSTHSMFDELAKNTETNFNPKQTQKALNSLLNNCVTCHKSLKVGIKITLKIL